MLKGMGNVSNLPSCKGQPLKYKTDSIIFYFLVVISIQTFISPLSFSIWQQSRIGNVRWALLHFLWVISIIIIYVSPDNHKTTNHLRFSDLYYFTPWNSLLGKLVSSLMTKP